MPHDAKHAFGRRRTTPPAADAGLEPVDPKGHRHSKRAATFKNAKIILLDHSKIDCIARNVSAEGCMITVAGAENLPDELDIRLDPIEGPKRAHVVWRDLDEAGLHFVEDADDAS